MFVSPDFCLLNLISDKVCCIPCHLCSVSCSLCLNSKSQYFICEFLYNLGTVVTRCLLSVATSNLYLYFLLFIFECSRASTRSCAASDHSSSCSSTTTGAAFRFDSTTATEAPSLGSICLVSESPCLESGRLISFSFVRTTCVTEMRLIVRYIESLHVSAGERRHMTNWEKTLNATSKNTRAPDPEKLPSHWLANGAGSHGTSVEALWALRNFMMRDSLNLAKFPQ
jgi:hypothetical protein